MMSSSVASVSKKLPARDLRLDVVELALRAGETDNRELLEDDDVMS